MNFFGHYFTDSVAGQYWYNTGLVYPDLFRDLYRKNIPDRKTTTFPALASDFLNGIAAHENRDKTFHRSDYFLKGEETLKALLTGEGAYKSIPRSWFLVHVLAELLTDKFLIIQFPAVAERFYEDLGKVLSDEKTTDLLFPDTDAKTVFLSRLRLILQDRFIFAYANNENLIAALWKIYQRAGIEISMENKEKNTQLLLGVMAGLESDERFNWASYREKNT